MGTVNDLAQHLPLMAFLFGVAGLCALMLSVSHLLGSKSWGRSKNEPFESGMLPVGDARLRFSVKFYLVAILFVIFEIEALFLLAWAVSVRESGWVGFAGAALFMAVLFVGLIYEASVGALDWSGRQRRR